MNANSGKLLFGFPEILVLLPAKRASEIFIKGTLFNRCKYSKSLPFFLFLRKMERDCIDLLELQRQMRGGIEDLFPERLWVRAEVASVSVKANGHCYMDLSRSEGGRVVARAKAVIWRSRYMPLAARFREAMGDDIRQGMEVLLLVTVSYSELYGLSLSVDDIEPCFSLGAAELRRLQTIERLSSEGLMDRQKSLPLPELPRRLAVISARDAAGYGDFIRHLEGNEYGFAFRVDLLEATMQGADAPASICDALAAAESSGERYDAVLILRGGGSALDLACFDDYGLCFTIANCRIPVFTAIGHERDRHIADMVARDFVKTPTALADRFIDALAAEDERISSFSTRLRLAFSSRIALMSSAVEMMAARIRSADPRSVLSRGYALVTDARGVVLKSSSGIGEGDRIEVLFEDGKISATVDRKEYGKSV